MKDKFYQDVHRWIRKTFGNANKCESIYCVGNCKYYDWALLKGKQHDYKIENYIMLCKKCHVNYDEIGFKKGHKYNNGRKFTEEHKNKISERQKGAGNSMFGKSGNLNPFWGKKHSLETILKIKETKRIKLAEAK